MSNSSAKTSGAGGKSPDTFILIAAVGAFAIFAWGFISWTTYRTERLPGETCLRQGDVDCVLAELNDYLGPRGVTGVRDRGLWELRLMETEGDMQQKIDELMGTPEQNSSPLSRTAIDSLLAVSYDLHELGDEETAQAFITAVLDRQDALYGADWPGRERLEMSHRRSSRGGPGFCWTRLEKGMYDEHRSAIDRDGGVKPLNEIPLPGWGEEGIACGTVYLAQLSDDKLQEYINYSLDTMRTERRKLGEYERPIYASQRPETTTPVYIGNIAYLASVLSYKANPQNDFGLS